MVGKYELVTFIYFVTLTYFVTYMLYKIVLNSLDKLSRISNETFLSDQNSDHIPTVIDL